jgi:hypothetical protein
MILIALLISLIPISIYLQVNLKDFKNLDLSSWQFYVSMLLGFMIIFVLPLSREKKNYSDWSILLHQIILDNLNISKSLFLFERKLFKKKLTNKSEYFVIVSGLARSGTTALTKLLFDAGNFHSLSYANMPFLLGVNLWRKIYNPKNYKLKERAHGDKVMHGYGSIEALEEYFFKVFLNNAFIKDKYLVEQEIDKNIYGAYIDYQHLLNFNNDTSTYLAKNNNLILRYKSLRKYNSGFIIILLFRNPIDHAISLLNQHQRFSELQSEDPFVLEYMNWLGHHEFGQNHKPFDLGTLDSYVEYGMTSINYWLKIWIEYYTQILEMLDDKNLILLEYIDFAEKPTKILIALKRYLALNMEIKSIEPFKFVKKGNMEVDQELKKESMSIYHKLQLNTIVIDDK